MVTMSPKSCDSLEVNIALWEKSIRRLHAPVPDHENTQRETYRTRDGRYVHVKNLNLSYVDLSEFQYLLDFTKIDCRSHGGVVRIHEIPFNYSGLIKSIYDLRPSLNNPSNSQRKIYSLVCKKLQRLAEKVPPPEKSFADRLCAFFTCHECGTDVEYMEKKMFT
jgi:hypothetical protein